MQMKSSAREQCQPDGLVKKVLNLDVTFHWIAGSDRFWFKRQTRTGDEIVTVEASTGEQVVGIDTDVQSMEMMRPDWVVSPDRRNAIVRHENDLWMRDLTNGHEGRLTFDGVKDFGYGDLDPSYDRQQVARERTGAPPPLLGVQWSPDSRFVVALRQDLRPFPERLFVTEYVPPDGKYTKPHFRRIPLPFDSQAPDTHILILDTRDASARPLELDRQALNDLALYFFLEGCLYWSMDSQKLFLIGANRGGSRFSLLAVDVTTGQAREVLSEDARFNVRLNPYDWGRPNVHVMSNAKEVIWYSERSGFGHLYLHDATTGKLKHQITSGDWVVFDLLRVDESRRLVYFTAASRISGADPYYRYLYCVKLDGGEPILLTPEIADHKFSNTFFAGAYRFAGDGIATPQAGSSISPSGRYFIDHYSTTTQPPEYVLRKISGELISKVLTADASDIYEDGWKPSERVVTKAVDGHTDLYGVIVKPRDFDPTRRYPVIDYMYPGPQRSSAPRNFIDQLTGGSIHHLQVFADAGFIVVAIDGRGTAHRSRAFRDAFLGTEDVFGAVDHVAAIENLGAQRAWMDLARVGVIGQSFGGYGALRALLLFPAFFKVCVSATGPSSYIFAEGQTNVERFFGVPDSDQGRANYDLTSNARLASRLRGKVLLVYGGIDESVPLKHAFEILDAFVKADKDVDLLIVPDSAHAVPKVPYVIRRSVQYFVDHLA